MLLACLWTAAGSGLVLFLACELPGLSWVFPSLQPRPCGNLIRHVKFLSSCGVVIQWMSLPLTSLYGNWMPCSGQKRLFYFFFLTEEISWSSHLANKKYLLVLTRTWSVVCWLWWVKRQKDMCTLLWTNETSSGTSSIGLFLLDWAELCSSPWRNTYFLLLASFVFKQENTWSPNVAGCWVNYEFLRQKKSFERMWICTEKISATTLVKLKMEHAKMSL